MSSNLYRCNPNQAKKFVERTLQAGLVPYLRSSPGMGKSAIIKQIAKENGMAVIDHRLSTSAPEDMSGLPRLSDENASFVPFTDIFPIEGMEPPKGTNGWFIFLDEFNSAAIETQAAAYKVVLDRQVGQYKLHPKALIVLAGNFDDDGAITNPLSTAMQSRVIHIHMESSHDDWMRNVALPQKYDPRIIAFLNFMPDALNDFKGAAQAKMDEKTFSCQRTWEFMHKLINGIEFKMSRNEKDEPVYEIDEWTPLFAGTITSGTAVQFVQFVKNIHNIPTVKEIIKNPETIKIPTDNESKWLVVAMMISETKDEETFAELAKYANRFDLSFRVLYFRGVTAQQPNLRMTHTFIKAAVDVAEYLS